MTGRRRRLQVAIRACALGFVAAWLFSERLQEVVPYWLPFAVLLTAEVEFVARGRIARSSPPPREALAERRAPGPDDADLGWGEVVEDEEGVHYVPPPVRRSSKSVRAALTTAGVLLAAGLFVVAYRADRAATWETLPAATRVDVERRLSREASSIARHAVTVRCDDGYAFTGLGSDTLGVAFPERGLAYLQPSLCRRLADVLAGDVREREDSAEAVLVLAHEAVHLGGVRNEGVTECLGLQHGVAVGEHFGFPTDRAERMMATLYERNLAERSITRLQYRLPEECRNGGALDLRRADRAFP